MTTYQSFYLNKKRRSFYYERVIQIWIPQQYILGAAIDDPLRNIFPFPELFFKEYSWFNYKQFEIKFLT